VAEDDQGVEEIVDGDVVWRFDRAFLSSRWACIWGEGCLGIEPEPAPELALGCCSQGADLEDEDEARTIVALAATLGPDGFEHHAAAAEGGVLRTDRLATRVVDGACVFLNRPGFPGGAGCALHRAALDAGEAPREWKPSVCWQLPVRVEFAPGDGDTEVATVRAWSRADWGEEGRTMAWCCTEGQRAYVGDRPVVESLADDLEAIAGREVVVELRRRLTTPPVPAAPVTGPPAGP
jgi:hypothetical protein